MFDRLGSNDPKVNGAYRFYVGATSTLATMLLAGVLWQANKAIETIEELKQSTTVLAERQKAQERRLAKTEDNVQDVLQRIARQEGTR